MATNYRINEIDAKVNGTWVTKYALAYTTNGDESRSLLASITKSGNNGTVTTLPATSFTYQTQSAGWTSQSSWNLPVSIFVAGYEQGYHLLDVNGDGLTDIVYSNDNGSGPATYQSYINTGSGWTASTTWNLPVILTVNHVDQGYRFVDVNGDGLPDIVYGNNDNMGHNTFATYINSNYGQTSIPNSPNFQRVIDAGKIIGFDRYTNQFTSIYTVITNPSGNLQTAFPGILH